MKNVIILLMLILSINISAQNNPPRAPFFPVPLAPKVNADKSVIFQLRAPEANKVNLSLNGSVLQMTMDTEGIWSATSQKLEADIYTYNYVVDGLTILDPSNPLMKPSYKGGGESLLIIPGSPANIWEFQDVPHGSITHHPYKSKVIGDQRDFYVYTPAGYDATKKDQYPVLYLFHGIGDDARAWTQAGYSNLILDNLIAQGKVKPMIVVNTLGYGDASNIVAIGAFDKFSQALFEEVIPMVEKLYNVSTDRKKRAVAGLSMGGAEAIYVGLNHPEKFAWVGGFSSAFVMYSMAAKNDAAKTQGYKTYDINFPSLESKVNNQLNLLWISCGTDDFLFGANTEFKSWLTSKNIQYKSVETSGAHTWMVWRRNLSEFLPLLFK